MNKQFDELTKGLAQSVTRRGALKKFAIGHCLAWRCSPELAELATEHSMDSLFERNTARRSY